MRDPCSIGGGQEEKGMAAEEVESDTGMKCNEAIESLPIVKLLLS